MSCYQLGVVVGSGLARVATLVALLYCAYELRDINYTLASIARATYVMCAKNPTDIDLCL